MTSVQNASRTLHTLLGAQTVDETATYRRITFCIVTEADGARIAYNMFTGEIAELTAEEADALQQETVTVNDVTRPLIAGWFLVPVEHDDIRLVDEMRDLLVLFEKNKGISQYTIFTTMDCNARCFYCFELGKPRTPMSMATAKETAAFIERTRNKEKPVKITWFGGEPLCNREIIDCISAELTAMGVDFYCSMISNGFLFNEALVEKAVRDWKMQWIQITLDGTRDVYNQIKAYVDCEGKDAFAIVTDNIELLMQHGIDVRVRMNMGMHNKEDLYALADFLAKRYGGNKLLSAYTKLLFEDDLQTPEMQMLLAEDLLQFERYCTSLGLTYPRTAAKEMHLRRCMADSDSAIVVTPTGHLGKCEHFSDSEHVGTVRDGITDPAKVAEFKTRVNNKALCAGCPVYPNCVRLPKCSVYGKAHCYPASRVIEKAHAETAAQNTYRKWKEEKKKAE